MIVCATIVDGAITREAEGRAIGTVLESLEQLVATGLNGATVRFEGVVRAIETSPDGSARDLAALDYTTYDPMAHRELEALARDVAQTHALGALVTVHSRGHVAVGAISVVLIIVSAHRAQSLRAMSEFIDRLKQDVPIWKQPVWKSSASAPLV